MGHSQFVLNAYAFLILGILLIIFNLPVLFVVTCSTKLRTQYGALILSLLTGCLSGVAAAGYGIFRLALFAQDLEYRNVPIAECFYNPITFILLWTFPMNGLGLLVNSIDRFLVIRFPISYLNYSNRVIVVLNILAVFINTVIVFAAIYITLGTSPEGKQVNIFCSHNKLFTPGMFISLAALRVLFSLLAVLLMFVVLVLFMKHGHARQKLAFADESMKRFKDRQMNYTKTMLISCVATIVLMLIPSIVAIIGRTGQLDMSGHVTTWTRFIGFFNSFNICILLIYRQQDIRWRLFRIFHKLACHRLTNIRMNSTSTVVKSRTVAKTIMKLEHANNP